MRSSRLMKIEDALSPVFGLKKAILFLAFCTLGTISSWAQTFTTLVTFNITNGSFPYGTLVQGLDGNLYGTTANGGRQQCLGGCGTVFKVTPEGTLTTLHSFLGIKVDGGNPMAALVLATNGNFYGSTYGSSPQACCGSNGGYIFEMTPDGTLTNLQSGGLLAPLIQDTIDGNFYGTTGTLGAGSNGTVFKMTPTGVLTTLHDFCQLTHCLDGRNPIAPLVQDTNGFLYGTTEFGGDVPTTGPCAGTGCGTVFRIGLGGSTAILHKFNLTDHAFPLVGLTIGNDGNLYGTTGSEPTSIFKVTPGGMVTTFYTFCSGACEGGSAPVGGLILGTDGNFYGTESGGGGYIYQITPGGVLTVLHYFDKSGAYPYAGLVQATDGNFYGVTTGRVGLHVYGTVFKLSMGLAPFVKTLPTAAYPGKTIQILGTDLTETTSVTFNGKAATFTVVSATQISAKVPSGATTGTVEVTTPGGVLLSNIPFRVF
jgi:uncharacterized repeat protein (TIGR03803 family)